MHTEQDDARLARIAADPRHQSLVRDRSRLGWVLSACVLSAYLGFILLVAFARDWLAQPLFVGGVTSLGIPVGIAVILFGILLTWVYVRRANSDFDARLAALLAEHAA